MGKLARLRLQGCHKKTVIRNKEKEEGVTSGELAILAGGSSVLKENKSSTQKCSIIKYRANSRKRKSRSRSKEA